MLGKVDLVAMPPAFLRRIGKALILRGIAAVVRVITGPPRTMQVLLGQSLSCLFVGNRSPGQAWGVAE